ncbi:DegV family protein [Huintestinicola sp.]|uniref:DegV family protein n=1 Tax=Huintestinicola sp. TaxID=2981661 RepID=UPI003D7C6BBE
MSKIKFITDSASDITKEYSEKYNIDVQGFPITVGDKSFRDGDIPKEEYYDLIDSSPELPVHSQLTVFEFEELFEKYAAEGYEDIFFISINSHGSATYQNACCARDNFFSAHPDKADKVKIRVLDSTSYSGTYGYPVIEAAKMAEEGKSADEIEKYLADWFEVCEVYLAAYTLRYVKKSGRISAAAAFAGELLGLKPVILLKGENTKVVAKPRGEQNVVPKLADVTCDRIAEGSPYIIIGGRNLAYAEEIAKVLTERLGYPPVDIVFRVGGAIAANSGPDMVATAFKAKKS